MGGMGPRSGHEAVAADWDLFELMDPSLELSLLPPGEELLAELPALLLEFELD